MDAEFNKFKIFLRYFFFLNFWVVHYKHTPTNENNY